MSTVINFEVPDELVTNYFKNLVNAFFKILPIREDGEKTLPIYIKSLQYEILGCKSLLIELHNNSNIMSLVSILQYLYDHPECSVQEVKREVFRAISICNRLESEFKRGNEK